MQASQTVCPQSSECIGNSKRQQKQMILLISPSFPCRKLHCFCMISSWCNLNAIWGSNCTPWRPLRETFIPSALNRFPSFSYTAFSKNKHRSRPSWNRYGEFEKSLSAKILPFCVWWPLVCRVLTLTHRSPVFGCFASHGQCPSRKAFKACPIFFW